ncbi:MAG: BON domain-containing protein [Dokdonella sp.]|jgi:osmotically-inducible protein OsmY|uniref:BON domain-containing protein n=1 Tax=Dokdonella sp. TaxID=2291710 RepID=UPI001B66B034|nr:BON domain-containing protein [Dokdonella sp.]MBP6327193.1 BON domain-containing protein [Dokdonella sp.]MBP6328818.1 BON domain-containing protein [Dokdonella sp.]HNV08252.1 BON domain-containing protein [Dokdonella sp.]HPW02938.1 BON domain-containing protein [Dokdonella sp.]HQX34702.1 BON domain-containing protein [Dokdonella sp.]
MHSTFSRPIALILLILLPLLGGCVAAVTAGAIATGSSVHDRRGFGTVVDDKRIQLGAYDEINRDKELVLKNRVMIAVYNGVMLLMGEVRTPDLKQRAEQTVTGFEGVRRIVNEIDIMEPEGFWTRRNDNKITARVKLALTDITSVPGFDATKVKVSTAHRTVYLMGLLSTEEVEIVTEIARNVPGVERVVKVFEYTEPSTSH